MKRAIDPLTVAAYVSAVKKFVTAPPDADFTPILPPYLDATFLSSFTHCSQKFFLEHIRGVSQFNPAIPNIHLHAGGLLASAIEYINYQYHAGKQEPKDIMPLAEYRFFRDWGNVTPPKNIYKSADRVWAAVVDYFREYPLDSDPVQPFFVDNVPTFEFSFAIPLDHSTTGMPFPRHPETKEPFIYCGRADLLGFHKLTDRIVLRDEKTAGAKPTFNWSSKWSFRRQFLGYIWAAQTQGIDTDTVCVRGITIQQTSITQIETFMTYPKFLIDRWLHQTLADVHRLVAAWEAYPDVPFDYAMGSPCVDYGGCPFLDLCTSPSADTWLSDFFPRRWNPIAIAGVSE